MFGRSRASERSSRFRTSAACITATNARQRNDMPADAFLANERPSAILSRSQSIHTIFGIAAKLPPGKHRPRLSTVPICNRTQNPDQLGYLQLHGIITQDHFNGMSGGV